MTDRETDLKKQKEEGSEEEEGGTKKQSQRASSRTAEPFSTLNGLVHSLESFKRCQRREGGRVRNGRCGMKEGGRGGRWEDCNKIKKWTERHMTEVMCLLLQ